MATLKKQFEDAGVAVKNLREDPGNDVKLQLYGLFKQGTEGDVAGKRPGFIDMVGRAKYDAWSAVKGTSQTDAMQRYIDLVKSLAK